MPICCIRLCDWLFCLYRHINYICSFVASYLFWLWYDWSLWRYYHLLLESLHISFSRWFFNWSLSDRKSLPVSWTLLSILAVLNNALVWMASTRPPTSKSPCHFNNPLVTVPKAPITIGIIVTFMFHSVFNSLERSRSLFFSHSFSFIMWPAGTAKSTILKILFFFVDYYKVWSSSQVLSFTPLEFFTGVWVTASLLKSPGYYYYYYYYYYNLKL